MHPGKPQHLHVLIPGEYSTPAEVWHSNLASIRLRSALAAKSMADAGWVASVGENVAGNPDVLLVGKIGSNDIVRITSEWLEKLLSVKHSGGKVILDYTDNHLGFDSPMRPFYQEAITLSDHLVAPGAFLSEQLGIRAKTPITLIPDPIEVPILPTKDGGNQSIPRALWFGHRTNVSYLVEFMENKLHSTDTLELIVLSDEIALEALRQHKFKTRASITLKLASWSVENLIKAAKISDMCIVPSNLNDPRKAGASSNRLITSLSLGLPSAVNMLPSYADFRDYVVDIESDFFREFLKNPACMNPKISAAQSEIVPSFFAEVIGKQWLRLIEQSIH